MKRTIFVTILLAVAADSVCKAQSTRMPIAPGKVMINGQADEWDADMFIVDKKLKANYAISVDNDNIYLVLKTNDQVTQTCVVGAGITWTINIHGKKSKEYGLTFPAGDKFQAGMYIGLTPEQIVLKTINAKNRKIVIEGFKDIGDEELSPLNPYGIKTALGYDEQGYLTYEAAIPHSLLKNSRDGNKEWWFNIKINGLERTVGKIIIGSSLLNRPSSSKSPNLNGVTPGASLPNVAEDGSIPSVDVWLKFNMIDL